MIISKQLPQAVPVTDSRGMMDWRWVATLNGLIGALPPAGGFVVNGSGGTYGPMTLFQGLEAARPSPENGYIYFALDTGTLFYEQGGLWVSFDPALVGDITKPANSPITTLATVFPSPGTYGAANLTPTLTIDAKGRVTNLLFENITAPAIPAGGNLTLQFNDNGVLNGTGGITFNGLGLQFTTPGPTREALSPLTTKGDIFVRDTASTRLPVGANGSYLRSNSATATGLEWVDNTLEVRFNFGDATPKPIGTVPADRVVRSATITILTPFDDVLATLALTSLMGTGDNLPQEQGTYGTFPGIQFGVNTAIELTIAGLSTTGAGLVTITLED